MSDGIINKPTPVRIPRSTVGLIEKIEFQRALILEYTKRLQILELQLAKLGSSYAPAHILVEIEEIKSILDGFSDNMDSILKERLEKKREQLEERKNADQYNT